MPNVSILIPAFNASNYIAAAIDSVLCQTYTDWELIVLDDCSSDQTFAVAEAYTKKDQRIRVFRNKENLGMLENWNTGIQLCSAPFFVKLDADDIWHSQLLQKSMDIMILHPEVALIFSKYIVIDEEGKEIDVPHQLPSFAKDRPFSCVPLVKEGPDKMLSYPILRQGLSLLRYEVFQEIGLYRYLLSKETQGATDTEFYFRVGAHYKIYCINETLYYYRKHEQSISSLDSQSFLTDKKLYEIKKTIMQYYYKKGYLSAQDYRAFIKKIDKIYGFSLIAMYRRKRAWRKFSTKFITQIMSYPVTTISFCLNQIIKRNT